MIVICSLLQLFTQNKITAIKSSGCNHTKDQFGHVQGWTDMKLRKKRMTPPAPATEKRTQSTHKKYFFLRHSIQVNPKTIPNRSQAQTKVNKSQISFPLVGFPGSDHVGLAHQWADCPVRARDGGFRERFF